MTGMGGMQERARFDARGGLVVTTTVKHLVLEGGVFEGSYKTPDGQDIADNAAVTFVLTTGPYPVHILWSMACGGDAEVEFNIDVETTGGSALTMWNRNHNSDRTLKTSVLLNPTVSATGRNIRNQFLPGGTGGTAPGDDERAALERVLKPNTKYMLRLTNRSGQAKPASMLIDLYEDEPA